MSDDYLGWVMETLAASPFVHEPRITIDDRGEVWFIRADVYFIDNSLLHFRELFVGQGKRTRKTYSFHYQRADGRPVFRYDDTPHYLDLSSAPHHKHVGENEVQAADAPDLLTVLKEIEAIIQTD